MPRGAAHDRSREPSLPQITSIDQMETILPRYVWVDEDDNQVSPIHKELRSAFNFVNGWDQRFERIKRECFDDEEPSPEVIQRDPRFQRAYQQMTRSGKPPVKLKRVRIEIKIEEPSGEEQSLAAVMMGRK
jgi:hypothetical protein